MGGHDYPPVPKPDTSMDHVFGDSSYKVDFDVRGVRMATMGHIIVSDVHLHAPSAHRFIPLVVVQASSHVHDLRPHWGNPGCFRLSRLVDGI